MGHLFEEIKTIPNIKFSSNRSSISIAIDGSTVGPKQNNSKLLCFLPTDDPSIATDESSIAIYGSYI